MFTPSDAFYFCESSDPNPPLSPLMQMVVNLCGANSSPSEVKNIIAHDVNVVLFEPSFKIDPLLDELTNPIQKETGSLKLTRQMELAESKREELFCHWS